MREQRLTFVRTTGKNAPSGHALAEYLCACGSRVTKRRAFVESGKTRSCGCLKAEGTRKTHGQKGSRTYETWKAMRQRCLNPRNPSYPRYGGRGITICDRWLSFENFLTDMGERPEGKSLDRINNDLGYSPNNCRWATNKEQSRNRRSCVYVQDGVTLTEHCERHGLVYSTVHGKLSRGRSLEEIGGAQ
jgi:hypothetical protein